MSDIPNSDPQNQQLTLEELLSKLSENHPDKVFYLKKAINDFLVEIRRQLVGNQDTFVNTGTFLLRDLDTVIRHAIGNYLNPAKIRIELLSAKADISESQRAVLNESTARIEIVEDPELISLIIKLFPSGIEWNKEGLERLINTLDQLIIKS